MDLNKKLIIVMTIIFVSLMIITISYGLLNAWVFFGMLFYLIFYLVGYFFIINGWKKDRALELENAQRKQKFEWCFSRVNKILKSMPGGQGIEWDSGFGRVSDFRTFHDGTQNKPFRSIMGYLSGTQQLVLVIYDIDNDDIVKFYADPTPRLINNHFVDFDPYHNSSSSLTGINPYAKGSKRYYDYLRKNNNGLNINIAGPNNRVEDFDNLKPDDVVIDEAFKKIKK